MLTRKAVNRALQSGISRAKSVAIGRISLTTTLGRPLPDTIPGVLSVVRQNHVSIFDRQPYAKYKPYEPTSFLNAINLYFRVRHQLK